MTLFNSDMFQAGVLVFSASFGAGLATRLSNVILDRLEKQAKNAAKKLKERINHES